jgi:hypothetical protein
MNAVHASFFAFVAPRVAFASSSSSTSFASTGSRSTERLGRLGSAGAVRTRASPSRIVRSSFRVSPPAVETLAHFPLSRWSFIRRIATSAPHAGQRANAEPDPEDKVPTAARCGG